MIAAARDLNMLPPYAAPKVMCQYDRILKQLGDRLHDHFVTAKKMKLVDISSNLLKNVIDIGSQPIVEESTYRQQHTRVITGWKTKSRKIRANEHVVPQSQNMCMVCGVARIYDAKQSAMICDSCGDSITVIDSRSQPERRVVNCFSESRHAATYENIVARDSTAIPAKITSTVQGSPAYKQKNHFRDVLKFIQCKSNFKVPQEMIDFVIAQLLKERYTPDDFPRISFKKIDDIVHEHKLTKLYSHTYQIHSEITGVPPPFIEPEHEEEMLRMFDLIQESFERHRGTRSSMLPCRYLGYKFSEIRGWTQYLDYFQLLKTREKIKQCDRIFEPICDDLRDEGFVFRPTDVFTSW